MVTTCSPHRSAGATLHLPSPTHVHHPDATSAIRSLRRSLSRSPSARPKFHLVPSTSPSVSPKSPRSPSPLSSVHHHHHHHHDPDPDPTAAFSTTPGHSPSLLAVPFPPSAKINRSSLRKANPMRALPRSRNSSNSPARRPLALSKDEGNATPPSPASSRSSGNGRTTRSTSPAEKHKSEKDSRGLHLNASIENLTGPSPAISRIEKSKHPHSGASSGTSSPLKRSDGIMNLDQASLGSPLAKRRSLHGVSFGSDFNVFDHGPPSTSHPPASNPTEATAHEEPADASLSAASSESPPRFTSMPKRSSSLRKSTLQQRHIEKPSFARARPNTDLAIDFPGSGTAVSRTKHHRMSIENYLPPMPRDSPFASQGGLPNASAHPMGPLEGSSQNAVSNPHPLSRTLTQSSSGSSLVDDLLDDSPTRAPIHHGEHLKPAVDFSKSLPLATARPFAREPTSRERSLQTSSTESSYMTPHNYKLVKPLPAAFMSTGLISKRNRNPEDPQLGAAGSKAQMPDTPCKRPTSMFDTAPIPGPGDGIAKTKQVRHEFGTPSTPFYPHSMKPPSSIFGRRVNVFGSGMRTSRHARRGSFASIDGNENCGKDSSHSPCGKTESQTTEYDLPPTPTKQHSGAEDTCQASSQTQAITTTTTWDQQSQKIMEAPKFSATARRHSLPEEQCSSPMERFGFPTLQSPHTPQESILPPDPSGLSISGHGDGKGAKPGNEGSSSVSVFPPATPTSRDYHSWPGGRRSSMTPIHGLANNDVDATLRSRFEKVELIGTGEFSHVYRVSQSAEPVTVQSYFMNGSQSFARPRPQTPLTDRVFAVKRSRNPYVGTRDRRRKLQEVEVLRVLGQADHVVHLIDTWEDRNHLYIQTEYCEEGSMDLFLAQVGRKARLDDFRIWKIMLEASLGIKHVHDAGFIHLDLKPANILITFEGVLKIGDFGMATQWPAAPGIEGEGDREYIGPEILMGQFDKPADIFALGLIMLEIAGNVELPDNGPSWQKLRSGDMSDVPSLTWSSGSRIFRDSSGNPLSPQESFDDLFGSDSGSEDFGSVNFLRRQGRRGDSQEDEGSNPKGLSRRGELQQPPNFMRNPQHEQALDRVVRWMISPNPQERPLVDEILETIGVRWAENRRRAGATVFEGNWGPADDVLALDAEMMDV